MAFLAECRAVLGIGAATSRTGSSRHGQALTLATCRQPPKVNKARRVFIFCDAICRNRSREKGDRVKGKDSSSYNVVDEEIAIPKIPNLEWEGNLQRLRVCVFVSVRSESLGKPYSDAPCRDVISSIAQLMLRVEVMVKKRISVKHALDWQKLNRKHNETQGGNARNVVRGVTLGIQPWESIKPAMGSSSTLPAAALLFPVQMYRAVVVRFRIHVSQH